MQAKMTAIHGEVQAEWEWLVTAAICAGCGGDASDMDGDVCDHCQGLYMGDTEVACNMEVTP